MYPANAIPIYVIHRVKTLCEIDEPENRQSHQHYHAEPEGGPSQIPSDADIRSRRLAGGTSPTTPPATS
jgi:hypothetical protein